MTLEALLKVVRDTVNYLDANGMFVNGTVDFANLQHDMAFISHIESSLRQNGVVLPDEIDKVIQLVTLAIPMFVK